MARAGLADAVEEFKRKQGEKADQMVKLFEETDEQKEKREANEERAEELRHRGLPAFLDDWLRLPLFADLDPDQACLTERLTNDADAVAEAFSGLGTGRQEPMWDRLEEIEVPVLVLAGEHDERYVEVGRRAAARIGGGATVATVPDAGHAAHLEQPDATAALVLDWLNGVFQHVITEQPEAQPPYQELTPSRAQHLDHGSVTVFEDADPARFVFILVLLSVMPGIVEELLFRCGRLIIDMSDRAAPASAGAVQQAHHQIPVRSHEHRDQGDDHHPEPAARGLLAADPASAAVLYVRTSPCILPAHDHLLVKNGPAWYFQALEKSRQLSSKAWKRAYPT